MADRFTVEHVAYTTPAPFAEVIAAFEAATGDVSGGRFEDEVRGSQTLQDFERRIRSHEADSGFMRFLTLDHGAWSALYGGRLNSRLYILGNPLIARTMMQHDVAVGLNVPVRVLISEPSPGEVRLEYDLPSSLMSRLENAEVTAAAQKLDIKLASLAERITGAKA